MADTIRVVICDDQFVVTEGLRAILNAANGIEVVGVAGDGAEVVAVVAEHTPDLVLMDLKMPLMNGVEATRELKRQHPDIKVLVLTTYAEDEWVFDAIRSGAAGFLLKDTPRERLIEAVRDTVAGKTHIDPSVAGRLFAQVNQGGPPVQSNLTTDLSNREMDILKLLAHGLTNSDIAGRLFLSEGTVRNYVSSILSKLNVEDRTQAAVFALRHGIVADD